MGLGDSDMPSNHIAPAIPRPIPPITPPSSQYVRGIAAAVKRLLTGTATDGGGNAAAAYAGTGASLWLASEDGSSNAAEARSILYMFAS